VRPGRGRPGAARLGLALWFVLSGLLVAFGPPGSVVLLVVVGVYLVGPLWVPVSYRVDDAGIRRATPFGARAHPWDTLGPYGVDPQARSAWVALKGRGTARFLPPLLLLWEEKEGATFRARLTAALAAHLSRGIA
jgi:hypothetical protein